MVNAMLAQQRLKADATNRGQRTFVQGLYIDLGVTVAMFILANISAIGVTDKAALITVGLSFVKTILTAVAAYVVRMYGDKSRLPTGPVPPEDPGPPSVEVPPPPSTAVEANDEGDDPAPAEDPPAVDPAVVDPSLLVSGGLEAMTTRPVKKTPAKKAPAKRGAPAKAVPRKEVVAKKVQARKATPRKKAT